MISARRLAGWGVVAIVALMPFHAFFSVWAGHLFGRQSTWQSWKELVSLIVVADTAWYLYKSPNALPKLKNPIVVAAAVFAAISLVVTTFIHPTLTTVLFGIKTDLEWMALLVAAFLVADRWLKLTLSKVIIVTSAVVIGFGLLQIYVLPAGWLSQFGYGVNTIQPYLTVDPALSAVRIVATLGGPNQLGSWLILPICLVFALMLNRFRWWHPFYFVAGLVVMWHTYSRSAWIGLAVGLLIAGVISLPRRWRLPSLLGATVVGAIALNLIVSYSGTNSNIQYYLYHATLHDTGIVASTDAHSQALDRGLVLAGDQPLGRGLGSAGPASYHSTQPIITESYYLQIAIEVGVIGLTAFVAFELLLALGLLKIIENNPPATALLGALAGISVINFFLHGWADSSTALIFGSYAGAILGVGFNQSGKVKA
jgi:hypothetical protein